jgi:ADP-ribosylglycohydrolase
VEKAELAIAAVTLGRKEPDWIGHVSDAADWLREDLRAALDDDPLLYGPDLHLFSSPTHLRVTFRLALWELFHAPSLQSGLLDVVNRGGEADVNAAVTGALLGAVFGDAAVPQEWASTVLEALEWVGGPHWHVYHPRLMITLEPKRA